MTVNSVSSQSVYVSVSVVSAGPAAANTDAAPSQPQVERGEHRRSHGRDEFRPSHQLNKLFRMLDSNKDGGIDAKELTSAIDQLKKQDPSASLPTAEAVLAKLDTNGDGSIGRSELKRALRARRREQAQEPGAGGPPVPPPDASPADPTSQAGQTGQTSGVGQTPGTGPATPTPVGGPTPADGPPEAQSTTGLPAPGQQQAGTQSIFISATVVTIAIRAYSTVAQATDPTSAPKA